MERLFTLLGDSALKPNDSMEKLYMTVVVN